MSYISTSKIDVFPSARRASKQVSARLFTEYSVSGIVNKLIDTDGFVITDYDSTSSTAAGEVFEFNIHGYYFKVESAQDIFDLFSNASSPAMAIYANIVLDESINNYVELLGQDDLNQNTNTSVYEGVQFTTWPIQPSQEHPTVYSLQLFARESVSYPWTVPSSSKVKFTSKSLELEIDGGEV